MDLIEKQRRMAILKKIDAWDKVRCPKCAEGVEGNSDTAIKCTCKAAVAVRKLGVEYEEGSRLKRQERFDELLKSFKDAPLSVEVYDQLKELGAEDKFLMKHVNVSYADFREWKLEAGRARSRTDETEEQKAAREEFTKWLGVAVANGVKPGTFRQRVYDYKMPYAEAVKAGRVKRIHNRSPWLDIAKMNGINVKTFNGRKRIGWSEERAATEPVRERVGAK